MSTRDQELTAKITLERVALSLESIADSLEKLVELVRVRAVKAKGGSK